MDIDKNPRNISEDNSEVTIKGGGFARLSDVIPFERY